MERKTRGKYTRLVESMTKRDGNRVEGWRVEEREVGEKAKDEGDFEGTALREEYTTGMMDELSPHR